MRIILGISAYYHDSAAALLIDGKVVAAAQEERFTRIKQDSSFPINAVRYVINEAGISGKDVDCTVFYEKPFIKFERILETYHSFAPRGFSSFVKAMPLWLKDKLFIKNNIAKALHSLNIDKPLLFSEHHLSHAASAYYFSPFDDAAILTVDAVGEWATTALSIGRNNHIRILKELNFPHSLGLFYSAFTYYCGFEVNEGEYKLMGLASYGVAGSHRVNDYINKIKTELINLFPDGSILLNMNYFDYASGLKMTCNRKWEMLFGVTRRKPEAPITSEHIDMAYACQKVSEEVMLLLARTAKQLSLSPNLTLAGGVALNCVANAVLKKSGLFENIWVQPSSGDAGGALGAAAAVWYMKEDKAYKADKMNVFLGPKYTSEEVDNLIRNQGAVAEHLNYDELCSRVSQFLADGKIVGWFRGRMEFGPRALGNRSILADARNTNMQRKLNLEIKFRESFRPFAPAVLLEDCAEYFDFDGESPYMLFTAELKSKYRKQLPDNYDSLDMLEKLYTPRSFLQAITHVDFSARIQTVSQTGNPDLHQLLLAFKKRTGCGILANTSFNVRNEPIVCSPDDAYHCFMKTGMDYLVINNHLFDKQKQLR
jgi:carbamoyltransferase